ncbi:MAG: HAMP domain-containing sensor histidine kinase [Campylobacterota bacterium]|nr:HAMP domain-containing sensor histidine kinase [Campylobacterota bacterium]
MSEMLTNITHQWKQPLSAISVNASGLQFQKELNKLSDKSFEEGMDRIIDSTIYLSQTIDDFHNFLKPDHKVSSFDLKECILKSIELIIPILNKNHIEKFINLNDIKVNGIKGEFIQVILNLLNNAKDVLIQNNAKDERFIFIDSTIYEDKIVLSFKDNGGGISKENLNKIFNQYFTTKETQGSGIGLYMSREIIEKHMNGKLYVNNIEFTHNDKIYKGAQFNIELPLNS